MRHFQVILKYLGDYPTRQTDYELVQRTARGGVALENAGKSDGVTHDAESFLAVHPTLSRTDGHRLAGGRSDVATDLARRDRHASDQANDSQPQRVRNGAASERAPSDARLAELPRG